MPLFKIWNISRTVKKFVIAETLTDLKEKCLPKFGFTCSSRDLKIVHESDGTEIDDTEVLLLLQKEILMVLLDSESWQDPSVDIALQDSVPHMVSAIQTLEESSPSKGSPSIEQSYSNTVSILPSFEPSSFQGQDHKNHSHNEPASCSPIVLDEDSRRLSELIPAPKYLGTSRYTPLPTFSSHVMMHLEKGEAYRVWSEFIDEAARFYHQIYPNMSHSSEYKAVGKEMTRRYPSVIHEGKKPWSFFSRCLSIRIRHLRWVDKHRGAPFSRRSQEITMTPSPYPVMLSPVESDSNVLDELQKACMNPHENGSDVQHLLTESFLERRKWIESLGGSDMVAVLQKYPCFDKGSMISFELKLIFGADIIDQALSNCQCFKNLVKQKTAFFCKGTDFQEDVSFIDFIFQETKFTRVKDSKADIFIEYKQDVEDPDTSVDMTGGLSGQPKLTVFSNNGVMTCAVIGCEDVVIDTEAKTLFEAVLVLLATYNCFGIPYPKTHSQILGIFQEFWLRQKFQGPKSGKYMCFIKMLGL